MPTFDDEQHEALHLGERLQWATIAWNLMEVVVTIWLGLRANSLALIAFGLDSIVEVFASLVVIWYIADHDSTGRALRAMRLVAIAFAVLGTYLVAAGISSLVGGSAAEASPWGIAYLALTAIAMFTLAILKRKAAHRRKSAAGGRSINDVPRRMPCIGHSRGIGVERDARTLVGRPSSRTPRRRLLFPRRHRFVA